MGGRRAFLLGAIAAALPGAPRAAGVKRVGILGVAGGGTYTAWKAQFPKEFAALGWTPGRDLELAWFDVAGDTAADLREAGRRRAAEMAAAGLDCLVANGEPQARMLLDATRTVPVVVDVPDPVANGFVKDLAHPGGNVTGLHAGQEEIAIKTVEILRRLVPSTSCMAWVGLENFARSAVSFENAAKSMGLRYRTVLIKGDGAADVARLREQMAALRRHGCLAALASPISDATAEAMASAALEHRLALASFPVKREGMLLRYTSERTADQENGRRIPFMVSRILRGEKPGNIPWEGPNRYDLAINLKTAARIGITVPADVLTLADLVVR